jgi:hypothetical protein
MRSPIAVLTACLLMAACSGDSDTAGPAKKSKAKAQAEATAVTGVPAERTRRLDLQACFAENIADEPAATSRCPSFVLLALDYMTQECAAAGGNLKPMAESVAWSLDVDGDASTEILVDLRENMDCVGAPTVFSCGSGGCPYFLYAKRGESWDELAAINANDAPAIEILPGPAGKPGTLRGGCTGLRPCSELTHYEWKGNAYQRSWIDFRGNPVDVAPGGLWTLTKDAPVLAEPKPSALVIDEYPIGTAVIVIGAARGAPYRFVSPCNACRRGFVDAALLQK